VWPHLLHIDTNTTFNQNRRRLTATVRTTILIVFVPTTL
jgi:hypothetical protein